MLITLPYKVLVDKDVTGKVAGTLESMNFGKNCAIICSSHIQGVCSNIVSEISSSFEIDFVEPSSNESTHLKELAKNLSSTDFVIGIGGGRSLDSAKYMAHLASKPWVAIPTILSNDGMLSSRAVLDDNGSKISTTAQEPSAIIADLGTIKKADYRYLAAGLGDLISNFSAVEDWKLAAKAGKEDYHEFMARLSLLSAEAAISHIKEIRNKDYHGLEILFWSLVSSGFAMNIYGSSRPCSGSEHNISHALDRLGSTALHGEQAALCTIISTHLQGGDWGKIKSMLEEAKLPTTAEETGIKRENVIEALTIAKSVRNRYSILDSIVITKQSAERVLKETGII